MDVPSLETAAELLEHEFLKKACALSGLAPLLRFSSKRLPDGEYFLQVDLVRVYQMTDGVRLLFFTSIPTYTYTYFYCIYIFSFFGTLLDLMS